MISPKASNDFLTLSFLLKRANKKPTKIKTPANAPINLLTYSKKLSHKCKISCVLENPNYPELKPIFEDATAGIVPAT